MAEEKKHSQMGRRELREHLIKLLDEAHEIIIFHNVCGGQHGEAAYHVGTAWQKVENLNNHLKEMEQ